MQSLAQDIDDLDRLVENGAPKDQIRSQIRLVAREVAALETDYARLAQDHQVLKATHLTPRLTFSRGLYYESTDAIPFCPSCWESGNKQIHLFGPVPMMNPQIEYWECRSCKQSYTANPGENFLAAALPPGHRI